MNKTLSRLLVSAALGAGALIGLSAPAHAYVVCNRFGDCWHTDRRYAYDRDLRPAYHPDDWYFHQRWDNDRDHRWHNEYHEGRGYWRDGEWHDR